MLIASCHRFQLDFDIVALPSEGSWEKNVALKPFFIKNKLAEHRCPLLFVDADAHFLRAPDFSLFANVDFSVRKMEIFDDAEKALNAATLFFNNTSPARELLEKWCQEVAKEGPLPFVDQKTLLPLLEKFQGKYLPMPISYCKIFDLDQFFVNDEEVVIEQRQASRSHR